ncbi:MAG: type I DNA topoisomerase [Saprospiraceae bacterium]
MPKNLLIVESPAKAKTIEKYLGKDFKVKSSIGHIRDLQKNDKGVDIENNFKPSYVVPPEKIKVVKDLRAWVDKVDEVWLATDEDREGEAISWHLCKELGLDEHQTKRIVFREITKTAIQKAITQPRTVDLNLVNAQQARRILDRLVGFELSGTLWKKVKGQLSAGRVQSVTVKLVVEREREIQNFTTKPFFKISAIFDVKNAQGKMVALKAESPVRYDTEAEAQAFLDKCNPANFTIGKIDVKPRKRKPAAPFTTSTLQQEASRKLNFGVKRTMSNAQRLYEQGFITYMRTDSTNLSEQAIGEIADIVEQDFGKDYVKTRQYKSKKAGAQEAHEAIRPTYFNQQVVTQDRDQQRLYDLIRKRTLASQMADAEIEKTTVKIDISTMQGTQLNAVGEVLKFDGFLKVYIESTDDEEDDAVDGVLPPLRLGQMLDLNKITGLQRFTRAPSRYTEASLVKKLEELGIGRPSTYAPTIGKIMEEKRGYVVKESREGVEREYTVLTLSNNKVEKKIETEITGSTSNRLYSTDLGKIVVDFLSLHFQNIMDYGFTAGIEEKFDEIADGNEEWTSMLKTFYTPFHETVTHTIENADRASGERILGKDPETGRTLLVRMSRYGALVQIGAPDELAEKEKPKYANLRPGQSLETITFEEAIDLFQLPKDLGTYLDKEVTVAIGRFGPYVKFGDKYVSIPKGEDPMTITLVRSQELIDAKIEEERPIGTYQGIPYTKGKGRFGPFLKWDKFFVNIPKRFDPDNLTTQEQHDLIAAKIEKEANRYVNNWEEEKISVQNGRWGPFIKFGKLNVKLPKGKDGKMTSEEAKELSLEDVKAIIEEELPGALEAAKPKKRKKKATKKK